MIYTQQIAIDSQQNLEIVVLPRRLFYELVFVRAHVRALWWGQPVAHENSGVTPGCLINTPVPTLPFKCGTPIDARIGAERRNNRKISPAFHLVPCSTSFTFRTGAGMIQFFYNFLNSGQQNETVIFSVLKLQTLNH